MKTVLFILLITLSSSCSDDDVENNCPEVSANDCFFGESFADCLGEQAPRAFCNKTGCKWFINGCPTADYSMQLDTACTVDSEEKLAMASFLYTWGEEPWNRNRAMTLSVEEIAKDPQSKTLSLSCQNCGTLCDSPNNPCTGTNLVLTKTNPGTYAFFIGEESALAGWGLVLEMDLSQTPHQARLCRFSHTDSYTSCNANEPLCAESGQLSFEKTNDAFIIDFSGTFSNGMSVEGHIQ